MKVLFVNTAPAQCGVHEYGKNLAAVLAKSPSMTVHYRHFDSENSLRLACEDINPDVILYNWHQGVGGWMGEAPFKGLSKQVLVYHDLSARLGSFDGILFSDPTMAPHGNWFPIGRPLNLIDESKLGKPPDSSVTIGINGLVGAWAVHSVYQATRQFDQVHIRMQLPAATFGDAVLSVARASARQCENMFSRAGVTWEVSHEYHSWENLVVWLSRNTLNLYVRNVEVPWLGVSSVVDAALCAKRPISVNRCEAFRHMHDCSPSIVVEDRPLRDIIDSGLEPLKPKYEAWSPEVVSGQVFKALASL